MDYAHSRNLNMEFFFFNELDNIKKFDDVELFPNIQWELDSYPADFVQLKISTAPASYFLAETKMYSLLCPHEDRDRYLVRDRILYIIHEYLMDLDYQGLQYTLDSDSLGVVREAHKYLPDDFEG